MKSPETNPFSLVFRAVAHHYIGVIAVLLISTTCVMWFLEKPVPEALQTLDFMIVSFLFGAKVGTDRAALGPK
jgi:biotin transporter BioY